MMSTANSSRFAVLGSPISHSKSPQLHRAAFAQLGKNWTYDAIDIDGGQLPRFIGSLDNSWGGLSLTMPLKKAALPLLANVDEIGKLTGAVNTVYFAPTDAGKSVELLGFNTDVAGIVRALRAAGVESVRRVYIFGGGATAASAIVAAAQMGATNVIVSARSIARASALTPIAQSAGLTIEYTALDETPINDSADVVISTLPGRAGTDISVESFTCKSTLLLDVAYDPWPSALATQWRASGGRVLSGLAMLAHQALLQVRVFVTGNPFDPLSCEDEVLHAMLGSIGLSATGEILC